MIVAALGQTILTTTGMRSGWINSTVSVSPPLIGPEDRMVDLATGTRFLDKWVSGPSGAAISGRATSLVWLVHLGQPITSDRLHDQLDIHRVLVQSTSSESLSQKQPQAAQPARTCGKPRRFGIPTAGMPGWRSAQQRSQVGRGRSRRPEPSALWRCPADACPASR
jgi:hypothetical protein